MADVGGPASPGARLHARGADVVAVEPGDGTAAEFRRAHPRIPLAHHAGHSASASPCPDPYRL